MEVVCPFSDVHLKGDVEDGSVFTSVFQKKNMDQYLGC